MIVFKTCQPLNKHQRQLQQPDVFFVSSPASLFPAQEEWSNVWTKRLSLWPIHSLAFVQTLPAVHHLERSAAKISITETSINQIREWASKHISLRSPASNHHIDHQIIMVLDKKKKKTRPAVSCWLKGQGLYFCPPVTYWYTRIFSCFRFH